MGMTPSSMRLLAKAHKQHDFSGPVLTFGNQDIWATFDDAKRIIEGAGLPVNMNAVRRPHTSNLFRQLSEKHCEYAEFIHAETLFEMMGFVGYADIDKYSQDGPAIVHDLNSALPSEYHGKYGLVLDCGTTEHIFDVPNVLGTVVEALKPGGWVVHCLPLPCPYWAQHGYYCFNPDLLIDYYGKNGFQNLDCKIVFYKVPYRSRNWHRVLKGKARCLEYRPGVDLRRILPSRAMPLTWFVAQKGTEQRSIVVPNQGEDGGYGAGGSGYEWIERRRLLKKILVSAYVATEPVSSMVHRRLRLMAAAKI
jgi:hypothetical protein